MPHLHLNISHNLKFRPDFLLGLTLPGCDWALGAVVSLQEFSARSCTRLAGPYLHEDPAENIFRDLSAYGAPHCNPLIELWETLPVFDTACRRIVRPGPLLEGIHAEAVYSLCGKARQS